MIEKPIGNSSLFTNESIQVEFFMLNRLQDTLRGRGEGFSKDGYVSKEFDRGGALYL